MNEPIEVADEGTKGCKLLNERWPEKSLMALELIKNGDYRFIELSTPTITFWCNNGWGQYLIEGWNGRALELRLMIGKKDKP